MPSKKSWLERAVQRLRSFGAVVVPKAKRVGYAFTRSIGSKKNPDFEGPPVDLTEVQKAYARDGYVRHAVDKYVELILRRGWELVGRNEKAIDYVRKRLRLMAAMSDMSTDQLILSIVDDFEKYSNSFLVKVYIPNNYTLPVPARGLNGKRPLGALFPLSPITIRIAQDKYGNILKYRQQSPFTMETKEFKPEDIIHIDYKKERGRLWAVPWLWPVLEDVKLLRQLEENTAKLSHKHLFPLIHAIVGLAQEGFQASDEEIEDAIEMLRQMPEDGVFVSSERIKLEVKGVEGESLDIKPLMEYFEKRIFSGFGLSELEMGRSGQANRGTADTLSESARDRVKMKQQIIADKITNEIINTFLYEGGFNPLLNPDDAVVFEFRAIDIDEQQKKENGAVFLWEHNAITFDELRKEIGRDPLEDEEGLYFNKITRAQLKYASELQNDTAETDNKQQPENQHGKKSNHDKPVNQSLIESHSSPTLDEYNSLERALRTYWTMAKNDILKAIDKFFIDKERQYPITMSGSVSQPLKLISTAIFKQSRQAIQRALIKGSTQAAHDLNKPPLIQNAQTNSTLIAREFDNDVIRLIGEIEQCIQKFEDIEDMSKEEIKLKVNSTFDALQHRLKFISDYRIQQSYNYGYALAGRSLGESVAYIEKGACEKCQSAPTELDLNGPNILRNMPPYHSFCRCKLTFAKEVSE